MKRASAKKIRIAILAAAFVVGILLAGCDDAGAPVPPDSNGSVSGETQPAEPEKPEQNHLNALTFSMVNGAFQQRQFGNYYIIEQTFNVKNTSDKDVLLSDFVKKGVVEGNYMSTPLAAFDDVNIRSKTVKAQTPAGTMPCIVAYSGGGNTGIGNLKAGETIPVDICVRIPKNVVDVIFLNYGNKIGAVQRETAFDTVDPMKPERSVGATMNVLQVEATAQLVSVNDSQLVYHLRITNRRTNPLPIMLHNFKVEVSDGRDTVKYVEMNGLQIENALLDTNLKKDGSVEGNLTVTLKNDFKAGDTAKLVYCPDLNYNEFSMSWVYKE